MNCYSVHLADLTTRILPHHVSVGVVNSSKKNGAVSPVIVESRRCALLEGRLQYDDHPGHQFLEETLQQRRTDTDALPALVPKGTACTAVLGAAQQYSRTRGIVY